MAQAENKNARIARHQARAVEQYRRLNPLCKKGQTVFTGSSLMEMFPVNELAQSMGLDVCIYNRGISGYVTSQMLENINEMILDLAPSKLFINIGTNDIGHGLGDVLWENYYKIINIVKSELPGCRIYVMAYYPCNDLDDFGLTEEERSKRFKTRTPESLLAANKRLEAMAEELGCKYIDVNEGLFDDKGRLKAEYCIDGVHMYPDGYAAVMKNLIPYLGEK